MSNIESKIMALVADQLSVDPALVTRSANLMEDLGADSLDVVELTMAVEERFGVTVEDDQAEQLATVEDIISFLEDARVEPA